MKVSCHFIRTIIHVKSLKGQIAGVLVDYFRFGCNISRGSVKLKTQKEIESRHTVTAMATGIDDATSLEDSKDKFEYVSTKASPFSEIYKSDFEVDKVKFNTAEQYMMYRKAELFRDEETADQILKSQNPQNQKKLGKKIKDVDEKEWRKNCLRIAEEANLAKFTQNEEMKKQLLKTHPKLLVKASEHDDVLGIGCAENDPKAWNKHTWPGRNYFGQSLTNVRENIMSNRPLSSARDGQSEEEDEDLEVGTSPEKKKKRKKKKKNKKHTAEADHQDEKKGDCVTENGAQDDFTSTSTKMQNLGLGSPEDTKQQENKYSGDRNGGDKFIRTATSLEEAKKKYEFFWRSKSPFSQWHSAQFVIDGVEFNCAEQYMMYKKAELMGDREIGDKVLGSNDPKEQKSLGRKVKHWDEKKWNDNCRRIVEEANYAKFSQNGHLKKILLRTHPKILVEASPVDAIWGIGYAEDHINAWDERSWRGTNYLGYALTNVREKIMRDMP